MTTDAMIDLFDGKHLSELEICEAGFLYAGRLTDLDSGSSWRFVYRSPHLRPNGSLHRQTLEWLDGAVPVGDAQTATDPDMLRGAGELTLWEP